MRRASHALVVGVVVVAGYQARVPTAALARARRGAPRAILQGLPSLVRAACVAARD